MEPCGAKGTKIRVSLQLGHAGSRWVRCTEATRTKSVRPELQDRGHVLGLGSQADGSPYIDLVWAAAAMRHILPHLPGLWEGSGSGAGRQRSGADT